MKQKSLMSFFGKTPTKDDAGNAKAAVAQKPKVAATPKTTKTSTKENVQDVDASSPIVKEARTPLPKGSSQSSGIVSATYTRSSEGGSSARDTPPTSDPIDVDMLTDGDEQDATRSSPARPVCDVLYALLRELTRV